MDNQNRFKQAMAALAAVYQNAMQNEQILMYWEALQGFKPDHLDLAVKDHIADTEQGQWFPKPAQLISHIRKYEARDKSVRSHQLQLENRKPVVAPSEEQKAKIREMLKGLKNEL